MRLTYPPKPYKPVFAGILNDDDYDMYFGEYKDYLQNNEIETVAEPLKDDEATSGPASKKRKIYPGMQKPGMFFEKLDEAKPANK